jgi:hypothetical protein
MAAVWTSATATKDPASADQPRFSMIDPATGGPKRVAMPPACAMAPIVRADDACVPASSGTEANRAEAQMPQENA